MPGMESTPAFPWLGGWYAAVGEQFTHFGTLQFDGNEIANPDRAIPEQLDYAACRRLRHHQSLRIADHSLLLKTVLFHYASPARRSFEFRDKNPIAIEHEPDFTVSAILLTGIEFPTGDSSRLEEEFHEIEVPGAPESGIHGHDLTLGTGSYDGIFGEQTSLRYKNFFFETNVQFTLRGDGTHQYHFANDLLWAGSPGYYLVRRREAIFGVQFVVSGEYKDVDRFRGKEAEDTGITSVFLGPRLVASRGRWSAEVAAELPVLIDNTALQLCSITVCAPEYPYSFRNFRPDALQARG
jgi:hypothetical protein